MLLFRRGREGPAIPNSYIGVHFHMKNNSVIKKHFLQLHILKLNILHGLTLSYIRVLKIVNFVTTVKVVNKLNKQFL